MSNSTVNNLKLIEQIHKDHPVSYSKVIKKIPNLLPWLSEYVGFESSSIPEMVYAVLHPDQNRWCASGRARKFRNINVGWLGCGDRSCEYCKQTAKNKAKQTSLDRYGVENPMMSDDVKQRVKQTNIARYGVEWTQSAPAVQEKRKQTCLEKYGATHAWKTVQGQQMRKQTLLKKYGVENPSQSKLIQAKKTQTFQQKYGVNHPMQVPGVRQRLADTNLARYGVDNPSKLPQIRNQASATMLDRYGVAHASQSPVFVEKQQSTMLDRYGYKSPAQVPEIQETIQATKRQGFFERLTERNKGTVTALFELDQYRGVGLNYPWLCNSCHTSFHDTLDDGWVPRCPSCFPISKSIGEDQVYSFVCSLIDASSVIRNTRSVIGPRELDIYIPSYSLAIEFNGLYHHSQVAGSKDSNYHNSKRLEAAEKGIRLIQIFDCEWFSQQDIVKSRIRNALRLSTRIYARHCQIREISPETKRAFLNGNHIQGDCQSLYNIGLFSGGKLVAVMTFGQARYTAADFELIRYCSVNASTVVGGASKLLKYFEQLHPNSTIVSYCDLRFGTGTLYTKLGFDLLHESRPNYWYIHGRQKGMLSRVKFQKHKLKHILENFDPAQSEWANMQANGYDRVWDCGNLVFLKSPNRTRDK